MIPRKKSLYRTYSDDIYIYTESKTWWLRNNNNNDGNENNTDAIDDGKQNNNTDDYDINEL